MENSTPCKIVTPKNFILKLGTRDYVENITRYTNFHVHRFSGGFSTNRWNITLLWLFSCPVLSFFLDHTPSSNRATDFRGLWLIWRGSARGRFVRFRRNVVEWCSLTLLNVATVENLKFLKSKMAAAAILNNKKSPYVGRDLSDLVEIWHSEVVRPSWRVWPLKI